MPLGKDAKAGDWIHDFVHSSNPKFKGKSKQDRIRMALGAYYNHHALGGPVRRYAAGGMWGNDSNLFQPTNGGPRPPWGGGSNSPPAFPQLPASPSGSQQNPIALPASTPSATFLGLTAGSGPGSQYNGAMPESSYKPSYGAGTWYTAPDTFNQFTTRGETGSNWFVPNSQPGQGDILGAMDRALGPNGTPISGLVERYIPGEMAGRLQAPQYSTTPMPADMAQALQLPGVTNAEMNGALARWQQKYPPAAQYPALPDVGNDVGQGLLGQGKSWLTGNYNFQYPGFSATEGSGMSVPGYRPPVMTAADVAAAAASPITDGRARGGGVRRRFADGGPTGAQADPAYAGWPYIPSAADPMVGFNPGAAASPPAAPSAPAANNFAGWPYIPSQADPFTAANLSATPAAPAAAPASGAGSGYPYIPSQNDPFTGFTPSTPAVPGAAPTGSGYPYIPSQGDPFTGFTPTTPAVPGNYAPITWTPPASSPPPVANVGGLGAIDTSSPAGMFGFPSLPFDGRPPPDGMTQPAGEPSDPAQFMPIVPSPDQSPSYLPPPYMAPPYKDLLQRMMAMRRQRRGIG